MPRPIDFAIVLHFHQPVGNFDKVFHRAYENCYIKFLEVLQKYPQIKMTLHFSGSLLIWIEKNHPEFLEIINKLTRAGQIEIISGGFYEPILSAISEEDAIGQVKMLNDYIDKKFQYKARGLWISERVWEPQMASILIKAKIDHVILDDTHFMRAGLDKSQTYGYYITKKGTKFIAFFGSDKPLRYYIPFKEPEKSIEYIKRVSRKNKNAFFLYADDAEKFGEWPNTYKLVHEDGWLKRFFKLLIDNGSWLKTITLKEAMKAHAPLGNIHIPAGSYEEMLEWSSGSWKNFFNKYPESNQMHKKMMLISKRLKALRKKHKTKQYNILLDMATDYLYKGQSSCAYWHGLFGGLYLFNLRGAIYENLIKAQAILDKIEYESDDIKIIDYNLDNFKEIIYSNQHIVVYFSPHRGGSIIELDYKPRAANLTNTISRKKEAYHKRIEKTKITYDLYSKNCLIDHVMPAATTHEKFRKGKFKNIDDFINKDYSYKVINSKSEKKVVLKARSKNLIISKSINLKTDTAGLTAEYNLKNISARNLNFILGVEFNIIMPDGVPPQGLDSAKELDNVSTFNIKAQHADMSLDFELTQSSRIWTYSINTVSRSEKEFKYNYQGTTILFNWPVKLPPKDSKNFSIKLRIS